MLWALPPNVAYREWLERYANNDCHASEGYTLQDGEPVQPVIDIARLMAPDSMDGDPVPFGIRNTFGPGAGTLAERMVAVGLAPDSKATRREITGMSLKANSAILTPAVLGDTESGGFFDADLDTSSGTGWEELNPFPLTSKYSSADLVGSVVGAHDTGSLPSKAFNRFGWLPEGPGLAADAGSMLVRFDPAFVILRPKTDVQPSFIGSLEIDPEAADTILLTLYGDLYL